MPPLSWKGLSLWQTSANERRLTRGVGNTVIVTLVESVHSPNPKSAVTVNVYVELTIGFA